MPHRYWRKQLPVLYPQGLLDAPCSHLSNREGLTASSADFCATCDQKPKLCNSEELWVVEKAVPIRKKHGSLAAACYKLVFIWASKMCLWWQFSAQYHGSDVLFS